MSTTTDRQLLLSILDYLHNNKNASNNSASVEESIRLLEQAFGIRKDDMSFRSEYGISTDLFSIFKSYVETNHISTKPSNPLGNPDTNPELKTFLTNLESRGYFSGVDPSSEEYKQRYEKAVSKYLQRKEQTTAKEVNSDLVAKAEEYKEQGNVFFRRGEFEEAIKCYTDAINQCNDNPKKYIYLCNRATASFYLNDFEMAEKDCKECLGLNPKHMKAYTRLAAVYQKLNRDMDAIHVCEEGLKQDPSFTELSTTLEKLKAKNGMPQSGPTPNMGNMGNMADMLGSIASDPSIQEAAQEIRNGNFSGIGNLLNNPAVSQMANNIMSNPELMGNIMSTMGSMFGGQNGGANQSQPAANTTNTTNPPNQGGINPQAAFDMLRNMFGGAQQSGDSNQQNNNNNNNNNSSNYYCLFKNHSFFFFCFFR